jgi:hypothetical protein
MAYQLIKDLDGNATTIKFTDDDGEVKFIPVDKANRHYQEYLEWTKASPMNIPEPADEEGV